MYASGLLIFIRENINCASALSLSHKIWFRLFLRANLRDGNFPPVIGMHHAIVGCGPANKRPKDIDQGHHCSCCRQGTWHSLGAPRAPDSADGRSPSSKFALCACLPSLAPPASSRPFGSLLTYSTFWRWKREDADHSSSLFSPGTYHICIFSLSQLNLHLLLADMFSSVSQNC